MPVTTGTYSNVETQCYEYLATNSGFNTAIICGILANIEGESSFNPTVVNEKGAVGLFQYLGSRKDKLLISGVSSIFLPTIPTVEKQIDFMLNELDSTETGTRDAIKDLPDTAEGAYQAGKLFSEKFERHGDPNLDEKRGVRARDDYYPYYSGEGGVVSNNYKTLGPKVVEYARSVVGNAYSEGGSIDDNTEKGADCAGLIYYTYAAAGISITANSVSGYYNEYKDTGTIVEDTNISAGDIIFYHGESTDEIEYAAIATGEGTMIYADEESGEIVEVNLNLEDSHTIIRVIASSQTSSTEYYEETGINPELYALLTSIDPYDSAASLSYVESQGFDYGYLIDLTHGGEFKFYIPPFTEQAGANWGDISIRGRSVSVKSYDSTNSRTVNITTDLYAGVGIYENTTEETGEDTVSRLHRDAFFVKSLEYPDYSNAIARPPSVVHLILGPHVNIVGVVSDVIVEHLIPRDSQNRSMHIRLSFSVSQISTNPPDYKDIRNGQYTVASLADPSSIIDTMMNNQVNPTTETNISGPINKIAHTIWSAVRDSDN